MVHKRITVQVSIKKKNLKYIRCQNKILKRDLHLQYKNYRNLLSTLFKDSRQTYFSYFNDNIKDTKKTWKGIKSIISIVKTAISLHLFLTMGSAMQNLQLLQIYLMIFSILLCLKFNQKISFLVNHLMNNFLQRIVTFSP